jgi:hypothetical protein
MEPVKAQLLIDRYTNSDPEIEKWIAFVEKYLVYGLSQKGIKASLHYAGDFASVSDTLNRIYIPVFTKSSIGINDYQDRVKKILESVSSSNCIKIGMLKDSSQSEQVSKMYPSLRLSRMYLIDSDNGTEVSDKDLWKAENFNFFLFKIFDLCSEIEREIKSFSINIPSKNTKAVYLAETTPDLISVREEVKRELIRLGYEVYPFKPVNGTSKEIEKGIQEYFQKSVLSIHLFGKLYQEAKNGELSRPELENKLAASFYTHKKEGRKPSGNFKRIIWLPDNLIVTNEKQVKFLEQLQRDKKLYAGADVVRSSVEELKDIIAEKLSNEESENNSGKSGSGSEGGEIIDKKVVYVVNSDKNQQGAESIKEILETMGCEVMINNSRMRLEKENLKKVSSVLFYYPNEKSSWLRSRICEFNKLRNWEFSSTFIQQGIITLENQELPDDEIFNEVIQIKSGQQQEYQKFLSSIHKVF